MQISFVGTGASVFFDGDTLDKIAGVTDERQALKRGGGALNARVAAASDWTITYFGMKGEIAVMRFLGLDLDRAFKNTVKGDGGVDLVFKNSTIDVKSTSTDYLIFNNINRFRSDIAVLVKPMVGEEDERVSNSKFSSRDVFICGWTTRAAFCNFHEIKDFRYGNKTVMRSNLLYPMDLLLKI